MKILFFVLLSFFYFCPICRSQKSNNGEFLLSKIPIEGILLDKGWKFYPGDDSNYTSLDYDGGNGIPVNPALPLDKLPVVKSSGIGWFRLKLRVDSLLRNKPVGITLSMLGAAEIYLNGELVYKIGSVSSNYENERTQSVYAKAFIFSLGKTELQNISVRYSNNPANIYQKAGIIPDCLRILVFSPNENLNYYGSLLKKYYLFIGVALVISLAAATLTLFFYFSFRNRKEYLYYGLFFTFEFLGSVALSSLPNGNSVELSVNESMLIQYTANFLYIVACLFYLNGTYALFHVKKPKFYWFIFWFATIGMVTIFFLPSWGSLWFVILIYPLSDIANLSIYYKAIRNSFRGAWPLFMSILITFLSHCICAQYYIDNDSIKVSLSVTIDIILPGLGLIVFLARDFANISKSLQSRLVEVQELSKKSIAQEREKQNFLTTQKDRLEEEVKERTSELSKSLADLKATQTQLIQSEKMASLGELTAGIAHEIQNPLNFVNNFSEVNTELIDELEVEANNGNISEVKSIARDIKENELKINQHGKRADSIVKGMLQHSRESKGQKELTDINSLADEYLRLAYHNVRSKDNSFNATMKTDFDLTIGNINMVPQDIGRVLLNLYNNAFYAVSEKTKQRIAGYEPTVSVSTKKIGDKVEIRVKDNGDGIPQRVIDKIFQPFFTTKPTGQGTGLGLSLSYDIVKAHGGEILVNSKEGEFTEFIIQLPA